MTNHNRHSLRLCSQVTERKTTHEQRQANWKMQTGEFKAANSNWWKRRKYPPPSKANTKKPEKDTTETSPAKPSSDCRKAATKAQLNRRQHRTTKTQTKRKTQTLLRKKRSDSETPKKGNNSESESLCCGRGIFSVSVDTKPKTETTAEEKDPLAEEVQGQLTALSHSATNVTTESELRSRCQNRPRRRRTRTSTAPPSQRELFCLRCGAAPLIFRCFQRFGFAFLVFFDFFFRFSDFVHFYNFEKLKNWIWKKNEEFEQLCVEDNWNGIIGFWCLLSKRPPRRRTEKYAVLWLSGKRRLTTNKTKQKRRTNRKSQRPERDIVANQKTTVESVIISEFGGIPYAACPPLWHTILLGSCLRFSFYSNCVVWFALLWVAQCEL